VQNLINRSHATESQEGLKVAMKGGCPWQPQITPLGVYSIPHCTLLKLYYFIKNSSPSLRVVLLATLCDAVGLFNVYLKSTVFCNAMQSGRSPLTFRRDMLPPSLEPKNKPSKKSARIRRQAELYLLFDSEGRGNISLRNVCGLPPDHMDLHPTRHYSS
jgi:hypothetical protein